MLVVALAALVLLAALAVSPARTSILRFFHVGAVSVERVETLPPTRERPLVAGLGRPLPRAQAERRVGFRLVLPPLGTPPRRAYVRGSRLIAVVLSVPTASGRNPVFVIELLGDEVGLAKKITGPRTLVEPAQVGDRDGLWIEGPHALLYETERGRVGVSAARLAGNALVWQRGSLTLRIEGALGKGDALRLARTFH
jgi:hypothetical protein